MKDKPHDLAPVSLQQWQHFGALLRDRRNAAKLSRLALAQRAKISDATIKFIETARHPPSRSTLIRLLSVAELHLTWAEVPGANTPPAEHPDIPAPSAQSVPDEPASDPAQFLMNLIGFDEIRLPSGAPKNLRIFRERPRDDEQADGKSPKDERGGECVNRHPQGANFPRFRHPQGATNRQGHGATVAGEKSKIAKVMGPPNRQGHGARHSPVGVQAALRTDP